MAHEYGKETLSLEFKSDLKRLPDDDLLDAVAEHADNQDAEAVAEHVAEHTEAGEAETVE